MKHSGQQLSDVVLEPVVFDSGRRIANGPELKKPKKSRCEAQWELHQMQLHFGKTEALAWEEPVDGAL